MSNGPSDFRGHFPKFRVAVAALRSQDKNPARVRMPPSKKPAQRGDLRRRGGLQLQGRVVVKPGLIRAQTRPRHGFLCTGMHRQCWEFLASRQSHSTSLRVRPQPAQLAHTACTASSRSCHEPSRTRSVSLKQCSGSKCCRRTPPLLSQHLHVQNALWAPLSCSGSMAFVRVCIPNHCFHSPCPWTLH
jgi:hypothetical protein